MKINDLQQGSLVQFHKSNWGVFYNAIWWKITKPDVRSISNMTQINAHAKAGPQAKALKKLI